MAMCCQGKPIIPFQEKFLRRFTKAMYAKIYGAKTQRKE